MTEVFHSEMFQAGSAGNIIVKTLLNALALFAASQFLRGVQITDFVRALLAAILLSLLNATLGAFLNLLALPLHIITFGLFSFVVDAAIIMMAAYFMKGFQVRGFWSALALAVLMAIFNVLLHAVFY
ncbi:MAG: phage holin family protein [Saprospiraceae bacterium]|nr:phage holin family protein [Saprospiraceae bacterium]